MAAKSKESKKEAVAKNTLMEKAPDMTEKNEVSLEDAAERMAGYCQWAVGQDGCYIPTFTSTKSVPPGVYEIHQNNQGYFLQKQKVVLSDNILELPIPVMQEILSDIDGFWSMESRFKKYKMVHKRGILLHGPPGTGKSYLIQNLINKIIKMDGIVFSLNGENAVSLFTGFAQIFRQVEAKRPLVVIIEDIDNIVTAGQGLLSALLNVLDGVNQIENVVYLATTNYPERLQDRISNRPSRFDRVYEIPHPTAEVREFYIRHKLHESDVKTIDMKKWVEETEGLSLSHIKELVVSTMILGKKFEDVMLHFGEMKRPKSSRTGSSSKGLGFGVGTSKN